MVGPDHIVFTRLTGEPIAKGRHGLWADMTAEANAERQVEHVCMLVRNTHPSETLYRTRLWLETVQADVGVALGEPSADPSTLRFVVPARASDGLELGDLRPGRSVAVWMRRRGRNVAPKAEGYGWVVQGETFEVEE